MPGRGIIETELHGIATRTRPPPWRSMFGMARAIDERPDQAEDAAAVSQALRDARGRAAIRNLRLVAFLEGVSYVLLLGIAMPLKYLADMPAAVRIVGMAHGILFVAYVAAVARAGLIRQWPIRRWLENLAASLLPFGPFLMEGRLRREQESI